MKAFKIFMKSALAATLCIILLLSCVTAAGAASHLMGDVDNNGEVGIIDVTLIQRLLAGMIEDVDGSIQ